MKYVDGFVAAVPNANKDAYLKHCEEAATVFIDCGALEHAECWGHDVPGGQVTDFHRAVQAQEDETVVFSWIVWPDRATRDTGMEKAMADPRLDPANNPMPFEGKRMIFGGFEMLVKHSQRDDH